MEENRYQQIIQFLEGSLAAKAAKELNQWRKAQPENEQYFQEVKFLWQKTPLVKKQQPALKIDTQAALKKVQRQLPVTAKVVPFRRRFGKLAVAATILLLLGVLGRNFLLQPVEIIQVATLSNETKEVVLPDQSMVWLNENSILSYPKKFAKKIREVQMSGEVIFEVTHNPEQPFVVQTDQLGIKVLGTKFNVIDKKETGSTAKVYVLNGKVQVNKVTNEAEKVILEKGMGAMLNPKNKQLSTTKSFSENQLFWHHQTLAFERTDLQKVIATINQAYGVKIEMKNSDLACTFTGTFKAKTLPEIIETLQLIYGFEISQINSSTPLLNNGKCQ